MLHIFFHSFIEKYFSFHDGDRRGYTGKTTVCQSSIDIEAYVNINQNFKVYLLIFFYCRFNCLRLQRLRYKSVKSLYRSIKVKFLSLALQDRSLSCGPWSSP